VYPYTYEKGNKLIIGVEKIITSYWVNKKIAIAKKPMIELYKADFAFESIYRIMILFQECRPQ
jgi:hypothetical protein